MQARDEVPGGAAPGSNISVLTSEGDGTPRLGARVFPLERWMARRHAVVGAEVAVTASLLGLLPASPTVVMVVAPDVTVGAVVDRLLPAACGMLPAGDSGSDTSTDTGTGTGTASLTLGVASPHPVRSATAGPLAMYNQHLEALPEALVEAVAVARRRGLVTAHGNAVLLLQPFVPATASAVVQASPARTVPVRIDGRWGLTEASSPADTFEVPADGDTISERLAWKPDAQVVADGGTHSVRLPVSWRYRYTLTRETVRRLATLARDAAVAAGRSLTLDIALGAQATVVLRCRPTRD
jgi:hypothetical protein